MRPASHRTCRGNETSYAQIGFDRGLRLLSYDAQGLLNRLKGWWTPQKLQKYRAGTPAHAARRAGGARRAGVGCSVVRPHVPAGGKPLARRAHADHAEMIVQAALSEPRCATYARECFLGSIGRDTPPDAV